MQFHNVCNVYQNFIGPSKPWKTDSNEKHLISSTVLHYFLLTLSLTDGLAVESSTVYPQYLLVYCIRLIHQTYTVTLLQYLL